MSDALRNHSFLNIPNHVSACKKLILPVILHNVANHRFHMGNLTIWDKNCLVLAYFEEKKVLCAVF